MSNSLLRTVALLLCAAFIVACGPVVADDDSNSFEPAKMRGPNCNIECLVRLFPIQQVKKGYLSLYEKTYSTDRYRPIIGFSPEPSEVQIADITFQDSSGKAFPLSKGMSSFGWVSFSPEFVTLPHKEILVLVKVTLKQDATVCNEQYLLTLIPNARHKRYYLKRPPRP